MLNLALFVLTKSVPSDRDTNTRFASEPHNKLLRLRFGWHLKPSFKYNVFARCDDKIIVTMISKEKRLGEVFLHDFRTLLISIN